MSEVRATYGGVFVALGLACLVFESPTAYAVTGYAWLGAALTRLVSVVVDRALAAKNVGGVVVEGGFGVALPGGWV